MNFIKQLCILFLSLAFCGCSSITSSIPVYQIVNKEKLDTPLKTQVEIYAIVSGTLTDSGINNLLRKLYEEANTTRGFTYHGGKPTHIAIWLFSSIEDYKEGTGQHIANLQKIGEGSQPEIKIKSYLVANHNVGPQFKFNLSESERKQIYKELIAASDRAYMDADRLYPLSNQDILQTTKSEQFKKNSDAIDELKEKYKSEVAKKYGITREQREDINKEGDWYEWPMPTFQAD